jgi:hypothetical protein
VRHLVKVPVDKDRRPGIARWDIDKEQRLATRISEDGGGQPGDSTHDFVTEMACSISPFVKDSGS